MKVRIIQVLQIIQVFLISYLKLKSILKYQEEMKNLHLDQLLNPSPGPTLEIEVAAPEIDVTKSKSS